MKFTPGTEVKIDVGDWLQMGTMPSSSPGEDICRRSDDKEFQNALAYCWVVVLHARDDRGDGPGPGHSKCDIIDIRDILKKTGPVAVFHLVQRRGLQDPPVRHVIFVTIDEKRFGC